MRILILSHLWKLFVLLILITCSFSTDSDNEPYPWNERHRYYFSSLGGKMKDVVSATCINKLDILGDGIIKLPSSRDKLSVASIPVRNEIVEWWKNIEKPRQMRVDPNLCDAVYTKRKPIFNNTGCQLPGYMNPSAPRCQTKYLKYICDKSRIQIEDTTRNGFVIPESDHRNAELPPQPWLLTARDSFVSMCGHISTECGLVQTTSNCQGVSSKYQGLLFKEKCPSSLITNENLTSLAASLTGPPSGSPPKGSCMAGAPYVDDFEVHQRVFVVAEADDTYVYHLHLEIMPRIIYHLDFLLANPDIKILIGCDTKKSADQTKSGLRHMLLGIKPLMDLSGLSMDRLVVHRHVFAREIYSPMEGGCQDPVYNTWQILTMRQRFLAALNISHTHPDLNWGTPGSGVPIASKDRGTIKSEEGAPSSASLSLSRPVMLLMKRSTGAKHTRNAEDLVRQWSVAFTDRLMSALNAQFPAYDVKLFSDKDEQLMGCHACQIRAFSSADVLIGMHGAGLSNQIYMKPNSAVVELCPYPNDGRCLLGGGPFSRTAALLSHNYMIHHPPHKEYKWILKDKTSEFDIRRFVVHIDSYLKSVNAPS